jgi:hypothetical protein
MVASRFLSPFPCRRPSGRRQGWSLLQGISGTQEGFQGASGAALYLEILAVSRAFSTILKGLTIGAWFLRGRWKEQEV